MTCPHQSTLGHCSRHKYEWSTYLKNFIWLYVLPCELGTNPSWPLKESKGTERFKQKRCNVLNSFEKNSNKFCKQVDTCIVIFDKLSLQMKYIRGGQNSAFFTSKQSFFLCVMAPQFSQAPFLYFVAAFPCNRMFVLFMVLSFVSAKAGYQIYDNIS